MNIKRRVALPHNRLDLVNSEVRFLPQSDKLELNDVTKTQMNSDLRS